jgi:hypothetical protein
MVQAWYQGGLSVFDFTDPAKPVEIAFFDRGPVDEKQLYTAGYWSTYWYNGFIYGAEIARGIDVFRLTPSEHLSRNEIDAAVQVRFETFNAQQQPMVAWPATTVVARAYLDQLTRTRAIGADRARAVSSALDRADDVRTGGEKGAAAAVQGLESIAAQLQGDAGAATGRDAGRLRALAETLRGRAEKLR